MLLFVCLWVKDCGSKWIWNWIKVPLIHNICFHFLTMYLLEAIKQRIWEKWFLMWGVSIGRVVRKPDNSEFASTHAKEGCWISKDDKDIWGQWEESGLVSDVLYNNAELLYPDCKVAEKLCIGGPCFYLINTYFCNSTILTTFICT